MKPKYAAFSALDPFFEVVQRGLSGLVDGEHYFDTIAKNAIFEFRYDIAGWPKRVESRDTLMAPYRGYGEGIGRHGGDGLVVHRCDDGRVIVIEYEVHGRVRTRAWSWPRSDLKQQMRTNAFKCRISLWRMSRRTRFSPGALSIAALYLDPILNTIPACNRP